MSKKNSITEQIEKLQEENFRLKELEKLFDIAIKKRFGISAKEIQKLIDNTNKTQA